jgi:uncharacterized Zn finger protein
MKTEVYSYRLTSARKASLERAARRRKLKIAHVLDMAVDDWLAKQADEIADDAEQKRLHAIAERIIGAVKGNDPHRSANVSKLMRESLRRKYAR